MAEDKSMKGTAEYVPGSKRKEGNSDEITRAYLDSLLLEFRHMGNAVPQAETELFGMKLATPVTAGALIMLDRVHEEGFAGFARAVKAADSMMWTSWLDDETFKSIAGTGVRVIRGIKPFENEDVIFRAIETAKDNGAAGIFMDIDHCFGDSGKDCEFAFGKLSHKTLPQLRSYVEAAGIPFIFKGILGAADTKKCLEIGTAGVLASHHKGIWSYSVPPVMMLPEIKEAAEGKLAVVADCGLLTGIDVFKALARGADAVCVARPLMKAYAAGPQAVTDFIKEMTDELLGTMAKCGAPDVRHIDPSVIRARNW